ncbi:hypothetical protein BX616_004192 [Lobosporangium transversale]|uniref:Major facilitator superfamily domain-containing protein n=1 Tax=Lobosporangium transversale TaxID=64571 RepID=A0A1Y2GLC7_9FUNG|nr:major facilitator superfamily domain-containing protein [Lobosporangium transversale]KAF9918920.1 hypothetical protein BX616_004192 [Lobosporangium transversale]ORZ13324.1 major facilitator superfamily domain-containing protein [Lobosporangium transversale]|eukprot:XP_021880405.1 major facilitator superfamily domain-containing protein [Lobosporangium transversale]
MSNKGNVLLSEKATRYLSLAIGILVMALSGSLFSFASFGMDLKARFGFNSSNINLLAAIGDTAMYVGFLIVGPIYDHYGERWTMITASILTFLGYGGMYIAYAKAWGGLGFLMVLYCLAGVASTAGYLAALAANMANFSAATSGTVSGVLLAFFGLSATLFSQIKTHLFSGDDEVPDPTSVLKGTRATQNYLLFLTIITTATYMIGAILMMKIKKPEEVVDILNSDSTSSSIVSENPEKQDTDINTTGTASVSRPVQTLSRTTTLTPSMHNGRVPTGLRLENWNQSSLTLDKEEAFPGAPDSTHHHLPGDSILDKAAPNATTAAMSLGTTTTTTDPFKANKSFNPYLTTIDMKPRELLLQSTFWFFVIAQVSQQGFSYINNVDSIIHAILNPVDPNATARAVSLTGTHVTLISIGNCLGRLASGILSDWVISRYRISRSIFFFGSEIIILVPLLIMGFSNPAVSLTGLIVSSALIGATYGATGALFASMVRDLFGNRYYGTACGMVMVLNGANPFIANQIYGVFYDRAVTEMPPAPDNVHATNGHMTCVGPSCYNNSFKVASLLQLVCILSAGLLFWAHMKKGRKLVQRMLQSEATVV